MRVIYHPAAEAELIQAAEFYEQQVPSLGGQFLDVIEDAVASIIESPKRWRILEKDVRRFLLPRFPFAIYYRAPGGSIRILAVKHHSRHPDFWHDRLQHED
jgi:plasmid stabilization system protein ParE